MRSCWQNGSFSFLTSHKTVECKSYTAIFLFSPLLAVTAWCLTGLQQLPVFQSTSVIWHLASLLSLLRAWHQLEFRLKEIDTGGHMMDQCLQVFSVAISAESHQIWPEYSFGGIRYIGHWSPSGQFYTALKNQSYWNLMWELWIWSRMYKMIRMFAFYKFFAKKGLWFRAIQNMQRKQICKTTLCFMLTTFWNMPEWYQKVSSPKHSKIIPSVCTYAHIMKRLESDCDGYHLPNLMPDNAKIK